MRGLQRRPMAAESAAKAMPPAVRTRTRPPTERDLFLSAILRGEPGSLRPTITVAMKRISPIVAIWSAPVSVCERQFVLMIGHWLLKTGYMKMSRPIDIAGWWTIRNDPAYPRGH